MSAGANGLPSARLPVGLGLAAIVALAAAAFGWGGNARIASAIIAEAALEPGAESQPVQHIDGGLVQALYVADGDEVSRGQLLVRLDAAALHSELARAERRLAELADRRVVLQAERDDAAMIRPDDGAQGPAGNRTTLFLSRRATFETQLSQLTEQQKRMRSQIAGYGAQIAAVSEQIAIVGAELDDRQELAAKGLATRAGLRELRMRQAAFRGDVAHLEARIGEAQAAISALALEKIRLGETRREGAIAELRELDLAEAELAETAVLLAQKLGRLELRAPVSGTVHDARVFAAGAVIRPAEPIMTIVPGSGPARLSARIRPFEVDRVRVGLDAFLRLQGHGHRLRRDLQGTVSRVSPDIMRDPTTGQAYYELEIRPDAAAAEALADAGVVPGTPITVFLKTGDRTAFEYLAGPLSDVIRRAWREG